MSDTLQPANVAAASEPRQPAARIASAEEALATTRALAAEFAADATTRDLERRLPRPELDRLSAAGVLAITVPAAHGGADVPTRVLGEVIATLAAADGSIGQIPQNHFFFVEVLRQNGTSEQQARFFAEVLAGNRFGNALAEPGATHALEFRTTIRPDGDGWFRIDGAKYYSTGALLADWVPVYAVDEQGRVNAAYVEAGSDGLEIVDDWEGVGQRTTASGTVRLNGVRVPAEQVIPHYKTFERTEAFGAYGQFLHAAIDTGIAIGALAAAREFVQTRARPWGEAGVARAAEEPLVINQFGDLALRVRAARALLRDAAEALDAARAAIAADAPDAEALAAEASAAVAAARAQADISAVSVASDFLALGGARAASTRGGLDRFWRDARTHTLHDPRRWKLQHLGNYELNGVAPPRSGDRLRATVTQTTTDGTTPRTHDDWLATARAVARELATDALERDRANTLPHAQIDHFRRAGLLSLLVPVEQGGGGGDWRTAYQVIREIAAGDGSLGQLIGYHFQISWNAGFFANWELLAQLEPRGRGAGLVLGRRLQPARRRPEADANGRRLPARRPQELRDRRPRRRPHRRLGDRRRHGRAALHRARPAAARRLLRRRLGQPRPAADGERQRRLRRRARRAGRPRRLARARADHSLRHARDTGDPARLHPVLHRHRRGRAGASAGVHARENAPVAAERRRARQRGPVHPADVRRAGRPSEGREALADEGIEALAQTIEAGPDALTWEGRGELAELVAAAKVVATRASLETTSRIFELTGARATSNAVGLDIHWRNVRTHTLHDPVAYKQREVGAHFLTGEHPPFTLYT